MTAKKEEAVLDAALSAFSRYGFRRVTMGDIAQEAGVSRPALYLLFPNKEAIFRAVLIDFVTRATEDVQQGLAAHETVASKLAFVFDVWAVRSYELVHKSPDAKELTDCTHDFASDVVTDSLRTIEETLTDILDSGAKTDVLVRHELDTHLIASVLTTAVRGFKENAQTVDELKKLIAGLIAMTVAALGL